MVNINDIDMDAAIERTVKQQEYNKTRNQDPEVKAKQKAYQEKRKNDPVVKLKQQYSNKKKSIERKYAKMVLDGGMNQEDAKTGIVAEWNDLETEFNAKLAEMGASVPAVVEEVVEEDEDDNDDE